MKRFLVSLTVLIFSVTSLYSMDDQKSTLSFKDLSPDLLCMIARMAVPDQMTIKPEDAVMCVRRYRSLHEEEEYSSSLNSTFAVDLGLGSKVMIYDATGTLVACYIHNSYGGMKAFSLYTDARARDRLLRSIRIKSVSWLKDPLYIASRGYDNLVEVMSIAPLLLARYALHKPTLSRYFLLKDLQEALLLEKNQVIIGKSERETLEEMPDLKKLLKIETNEPTKDKVATLWRLRLKGKQKSDRHTCTIL